MKAPRRNVGIVLSCLVICASCAHAQEAAANTEESCRHFAQGFYSWYVTEVFKAFKTHNAEEPWHVALKRRGNSFSRELKRALIQSDAEAKVDGDPVLDFDPILNGQDPAERYVVRSVTLDNGHCWAKVYGAWSRPVPDQDKQPQVVAEVAFVGGHWQIVNFHYPNSTNPENENLLGILRYQYKHSGNDGEAQQPRH